MEESPHGFLLVDKPAGITSHDVVDELRKVTGIKKIGHAGTLDPFATGLLIMAVGRQATREISRYTKLDKTYEAEFVLGATTETLDPESDVRRTENPVELDRVEIEDAMKQLVGDIQQVPPMYAAIKVKGKKLYQLARKGQVIEREPRNVTIHSFELLEDPVHKDGLTHIQIRTLVSSGTYIRALARDLGAALQTVGYTATLRRTKIAKFSVLRAKPLHEFSREHWRKELVDDL